MAIRGPRIRAGVRSDVPVNGVDLFATILELAKLKVPKAVPDRNGAMVRPDARSLTPVLFRGAKQLRDPWRDYQLAETMNPVKQNMLHVAARNTRYKVICANDTQAASCEFFDLVEDPLEEYPLARPASCDAYQQGKLKITAPEWSYCRLQAWRLHPVAAGPLRQRLRLARRLPRQRPRHAEDGDLIGEQASRAGHKVAAPNPAATSVLNPYSVDGDCLTP
ncbi:MAG: hypothetical protein IPG49_09830 [Proteobacteria bacterium]|nr:hypothetical protein [Pseudomonadota bacterium]